ncbi:ATP-binding protein [Paraburkholderia silviterrae]|uniref:Virulence sensor protein BvgS n=1 Tax=Paraburkholderia silviterrae TaxID=2528715 RepID=A0A4R5M9C1_9BURK|nr:transporter substrate-binding domain-containing protein [Paraburkholderia silviterrae]TDG22339.1 transporter substrate-binding domain-containing protein [Paraburkholderia silviterrae]
MKVTLPVLQIAQSAPQRMPRSSRRSRFIWPWTCRSLAPVLAHMFRFARLACVLVCVTVGALAHAGQAQVAESGGPAGSALPQSGPVAASAARAAESGGFPPVLTVGVVAGGWPPLEVLDGNTLSGFSADYLRLVVGSQVKLVPRVYPNMTALLAGACAAEIDLVMSLARAPQRERCLSFTVPYLSGNVAFVTRVGNEAIATTARRFARARIAVENGYVLEPLLRERFAQAEILSFTNTGAAIHAVAQGSADVYAGFAPAVRYQLIHHDAYRGLRVAYEERIKVRELRFAVPVSKVALRDQLNVAAGGVRPTAASALRARWLDGGEGAGHGAQLRSPPFDLDAGERAWLRSLPPLRVGFDAGWLPFSYASRRGYTSGMANDYLNYLSRKLGVTFERVPVTNWPDADSAFQRGEFALLATMVDDGGLPENTLYTQAFEHYPLVIVGRRDEPMARSLSDYVERRVVLAPHAPAAHVLFGAAQPIRVLRVATLEQGLALVQRNDADVLVGDAAALDGPLSRQYIETLKVVGAIGADGATAFAVRTDLAPLKTLIDRALDAMSPVEQQEIRNHWTAVATERSGGWSVNALRLLPLLIAFGVVLLVTLRAYVLLQREMRRRRRAEQVLAKQVELQDTMTEMIPYPLGVRDLENRYLAVNRAYEEMTGVRRSEVLGRTGAAVAAWGAENSLRVEDLYRKTVEEGKGQRVEFAFDGPGGTGGPDGEKRHGIFWTRLCRDARGAPLCVLGTMIDITEIRRAEMRARASERLLSDVTRSLPAIVFQLRRGPDGRYAFPYLGGDTERLLGDAVTQLMRASALDLARVNPRDRARLATALERSARLLMPVNTEFRFHGAAGLLWVRAEFVPRRTEDGAVVWSGYAVDANVEHARADELARARDLAEAASRAKDDFLAMMSHEIRTPMNGVLGLVEVLERTPLNPDQTQMVGMVHESAGALLQILDDLLDYSKIQAGRLVIASEPFGMRELVDNAVGLLAGRAHEKGLKVRVGVEAGVAALLRGDSVRLRQILFNLLSNAIKFTPHGEVSVNVAARDVAGPRGKPTRQRVAITVSDTGIGIAPEAQAQLFEPFVQAETSTTRRFGGTGLGLTISRKLAALMGGTLELHSEVGRGTRLTLHIELPLEARAGHANGLRGKRALVICDDARVAGALMHFGVSLGMKMTRLESGPCVLAAMRKLEAHGGVDLVFVAEALAGALDGHGAPVIRLTDNPKPSGYRVVESGVRVSVNPLSWRGLGAACAMALTGLPAVAARPSLAAETALTAPDREKERSAGRLILVAEDHPVNQELIRHQLALLGFACDVVDDGAQALDALEKEHYGCLITDCHMPNVSGYDLARRVREIEAAGTGKARATGKAAGSVPRLPILGITANTAPENLRLCREAGMDDCLIKPTRVATLRDQLARWFGAENALRTAHEHTVPNQGASAVMCDAAALQDEAVEAAVADPLDLAHMIQVWGSEATVKTLLGSFVSAMRDDLDALPELLEDVDIARLREWHHRLAGAVGVLHYPALLAVLETWRRHMNTHTPEQLRDEGFALMRTCHEMLDGIEQQAALLA